MEELHIRDDRIDPFINRVDIELKRAQRYQIFISLLVYDFSSIISKTEESVKIQKDILSVISEKIRSIDEVSVLENSKLALLLPETNRQGAEVASKRINEVLQKYLSRYYKEKTKEFVYPEMASYPDAAGTKTIKDFLSDYSES